MNKNLILLGLYFSINSLSFSQILGSKQMPDLGAEKFPNPDSVVRIDVGGNNHIDFSNVKLNYDKVYDFSWRFNRKVLKPCLFRYPESKKLYKKANTIKTAIRISTLSALLGGGLYFLGYERDNKKMRLIGGSLFVVGFSFGFIYQRKPNKYYREAIILFNNKK